MIIRKNQRYYRNCLTWHTKYLTDNNVVNMDQELLIFYYISWTYVHEKNCELCGINQCSDCYLISFGWIESTFKKSILILYLSWWDNSDFCIACDKILRIITDCRK